MTDQQIKEMFESYGQYAHGHELAFIRAIEAVVSPKREWVGLADEEISEAYDDALKSFRRHQMSIRGQQITASDNPDWHFARAIEAKLKEKNT